MSNEQQTNGRLAALEEELMLSEVAFELAADENRANIANLAALREELILSEIAYELNLEDNRTANEARRAHAAIPARIVRRNTRDALDTVINQAMRTAAVPDDYQSVFAEMIKMAAEPDRMTPLSGAASGVGIPYIKSSGVKDYFTLAALRMRMQRRNARL